MDTKELEQMLGAMTRAGASSLHLIPGHAPCVRVQRKFVQSEHDTVSSVAIDELTRDLLFEDHRARLRRDGQVDVLYVARSGQRFRTTVLQQEQGLALLLRPVPEQPPQLQELQLPPQVGSFVQYRSGLVLITGFFGSGKSTTLAALVDRFNHETARHVVTIEDPIEYLHPQGQALLHQRELGPHVRDYVTGIRQAMRLGAEVVVISELNDGETLNAALDAVESGCLVLAGFDASSVVGACMELPMLVPHEERPRMRVRFAAALRAVTAQTLLPCAHQQGRVPMVEILINNSAVKTAIRQGNYKELPSIMNRCRGLGMQTSDVALRGLLSHHLITPEEAIQHAINRDLVLARGPGGGTQSRLF
ncbi:MAG: type IV pilus twitching motility protein PilT [Planctomycetota bacterium]